jgi:hypothetical protein
VSAFHPLQTFHRPKQTIFLQHPSCVISWSMPVLSHVEGAVLSHAGVGDDRRSRACSEPVEAAAAAGSLPLHPPSVRHRAPRARTRRVRAFAAFRRGSRTRFAFAATCSRGIPTHPTTPRSTTNLSQRCRIPHPCARVQPHGVLCISAASLRRLGSFTRSHAGGMARTKLAGQVVRPSNTRRTWSRD